MIAWERNRRHLGTFDSARLEEEGPDGTYLVIGTTDAEVTLRVHAEDVQALDAALQPLRDYLADKAREKIAYDAAKRTSERARSLLLEGAREAYGGSANEYEVEWDADGWEER